ncbi:MAG TPA: hypothetical protein VHX59_11865 [Mycobacteriales bacterium]|nr:hypothetical protein [Mycobacteriales bacterium]
MQIDNAGQLTRFEFGKGAVSCADDGTVIRVSHPDHGAMSFLLDETPDGDFHQPPFRWGKGFLITDAGSHRWDQPDDLKVNPAGIDATYRLGALELAVQRRFGTTWSERYRLTNASPAAVTVGTLAISTPFRDVYRGSAESLSGACHAHIWTGGADSYVWAVRMDGQGPGLGLRLTDGELWSYSVESRSIATSSNVRGHLYLQLTDTRAPHAMGGQSPMVVEPGASVELAWELDWYDSRADFTRTRAIELTSVAATLPGPIRATVHDAELTLPAGMRATTADNGDVALHADTTGVHYVHAERAGRRSRVAVLMHRPLRDIVERRAAFVLENQRAVERQQDRAAAFLPYDTGSGLRLNEGGWGDWSDGRERLGMPRLLQEARRRGWGEPDRIDGALKAYAEFLRTQLIDTDGRVRGGSFSTGSQRLYNYSWAAAFLIAQYELYADPADLALAIRIVDRYYESGGAHFLAIGMSECVAALARLADDTVAERMRAHAVEQAGHILAAGRELPQHEVSYEQSMVAPLLMALLTADRLAPDEWYAAAVAERLPWLLAFAGDQPHPRLRHVSIRHWDGFWFGGRRLWGDTFPHYWTVLDAAVFAAIPEHRDTATAILRANLVDFTDDGAASCAFIYPSCVNGRPAHIADPVANDQDWALVYAMTLGLLD